MWSQDKMSNGEPLWNLSSSSKQIAGRFVFDLLRDVWWLTNYCDMYDDVRLFIYLVNVVWYCLINIVKDGCFTSTMALDSIVDLFESIKISKLEGQCFFSSTWFLEEKQMLGRSPFFGWNGWHLELGWGTWVFKARRGCSLGISDQQQYPLVI